MDSRLPNNMVYLLHGIGEFSDIQPLTGSKTVKKGCIKNRIPQTYSDETWYEYPFKQTVKEIHNNVAK